MSIYNIDDIYEKDVIDNIDNIKNIVKDKI